MIGSRVYQTSLGMKVIRQVAGSTMRGWAGGPARGEVVVTGSRVCHLETGSRVYYAVITDIDCTTLAH